ncbi:hypothetical protein C9374_001467 [Naegleria lovaniensis]|uniref:VPS9 domain-containing protein n=1 Tax=Naegleria lovaniensis TaxID=51637 RepID=A0AA88GWX7_NAELO|nr:uncharacterized protein C9374_001467 [Naegleria lovaniensis]KAG2387873.1 hypothetical protein C9374_001467 [Naegleria lovaniensis]
MMASSSSVVLYSGYLYPVQAFPIGNHHEQEDNDSIIANSTSGTNNHQPSMYHDDDSVQDILTSSSNLQFGKRKWFEIRNDYHLYQYRTRRVSSSFNSSSSSEGGSNNNHYEMKTNLLQYHHILPINHVHYSQKSFNENIMEIYSQQSPTYRSPLVDSSEEQPQQQLLLGGEDSPWSEEQQQVQTTTTEMHEQQVGVIQEEQPMEGDVMNNSNMTLQKRYMLCCKSDDQQEVLLFATNSEQKRSEWICVLKHILHLGFTERNTCRFQSLGGNVLIPVDPSFSSNEIQPATATTASTTTNTSSTPFSVSAIENAFNIESLKNELALYIEQLSQKIRQNERKKKEREERNYIQQQQSLLLKESIKGLSSFSMQSQQKIETNTATTNYKSLNADRIFHIESLCEEINQTRLDLLEEKLRVLTETNWKGNISCTYTLPFTNKSSTKPFFHYLLIIEEYIREKSPLYFQKSIQLVRLLLYFEWRHLVLSLNEISKELSRWSSENLKQLDTLYSQSFEYNTTKKTLSSTYNEMYSRYNMYTQAFGVTNDGSQLRLDSNTSSALNSMRQTKQELYANLADASIKLKQTNNQISLNMYQLGLIENLLIKIVNAQKASVTSLRYGQLITNSVPQRLFVLDENFETERDIRNLIDLPSKHDAIDICFLKLSSRHIIEKFKSRIERGDDYLLQLKQQKEEILAEIKSQQLASSEERKKHASQMIKQMQQRLRSSLTSGPNSNFFCTQIHQYVQKFLNSPINSTMGLPKLQDLLKNLTDKVISMMKITLNWYQIYEVLESMIFEYTSQTRGMIMYDCCLIQVKNEMRMMDENFYTKCQEVSHKLVGQLLLESKKIDDKDLNESEFRQFVIEEEIVKFKEEYRVAIELIKSLSEDYHEKVSDTKPYNPSAKLSIITQAAREVMNKIYFSKTKIRSEIDQHVSADDFVPMFICVICTAAIRDMFTQIGFIKEFAFGDYLVGEQGFFLSSLESSAIFIMNFEDDNYKVI